MAVIFLLLVLQSVASEIITLDFHIEYIWMQVDGFEKAVVSVNRSRVGPEIHAIEGDFLRVKIYNSHMTVTTHNADFTRHGIHMKGTPYMDGVPFVTQCPTNPSDSMIYEFQLSQVGTYWYHGHVESQRDDAFYGALIIEPIDGLPFSFDEEKVLFLSDFYHNYGSVQLLMLESKPFRWVGSPQTLLMNGELDYNITVEEGKTYLFRFLSASALSWYNLSIPGHNFTVVEVEASFTQPYTMPALRINSGERYSVLFTANNPGCYVVAFTMLERAGPSGRAFLKYQSQDCDNPNTTWISGYSEVPFDPQMLVPLIPEEIPPATRNLTITSDQKLLPDLDRKWTLNNISYLRTHTPILLAYYYNEGEFSPLTHIIDLQYGEVIDLTFEMVPHGQSMEQHPYHIHGHTPWILGSGFKSDPTRKLNTKNPLKRDTFTIPHDGWVTVRLVVDNPGVWLLHCHVTWHMQMGMSVVFAYPPNTIPRPPQNFPVCGDITGHLRKQELKLLWIGICVLIVLFLLAISAVLYYRNQLQKRTSENEESDPLLPTKHQ